MTNTNGMKQGLAHTQVHVLLENRMNKLLYQVAMRRSRSCYKQRYGQDFWTRFRVGSNDRLAEILPKVPDIGKSVFSFNYIFAPFYIAWYQTLISLGNTPGEADENLWMMNERMARTLPASLLKIVGRLYLGSFSRKAAGHEARQKAGTLHPYDWKITYRPMDANTYEIDILECAYVKLTNDLGARGMLPGVCRMDYLFSHLMGNGFTRTKTLADGDDCCNCRYQLKGACEWAPEKGFTDRK
ncbi:MAG TPA: L-2-amino-thiazoline-4-carboxylic acid hydrolase [Candidatus Limiplasma sp.]|nr:L-2-amino-thiazoline-4-carboxylic acid hydrolase [Candidatus Limiplasma sp.]